MKYVGRLFGGIKKIFDFIDGRDWRYKKKIFEALFVAFAIVAIWRGTWGLMDLYLFPNYEIFSYILSIILGMVILYYTENLLEESLL